MASVDIETLIVAARDLTRAGRWEQASGLLDAVDPDEYEVGAVAVARAEVEVDHAFWMRREPDPGLLDAAAHHAADAAQRWAARFARLRAMYATQLRALVAGQPLTYVDELAATAGQLADRAPDPAARAYATFYQGVIADNLRGDPVVGERHFRAALDTDDEYVRSYALRHLGGVVADAGRRDDARDLWRESTRLRQRVGFVPGALAQLTLQEGGAPPIVADWADALGIGELILQAAAVEPEVTRDPG